MYTVIVPLLFFRVYTYYLRTCLAAHYITSAYTSLVEDLNK